MPSMLLQQDWMDYPTKRMSYVFQVTHIGNHRLEAASLTSRLPRV
jgi:hypothetical protein